MSSTRGWKNLIRFKDSNGKINFGEADNDDLKAATIWEGDSILNLTKTEKHTDVAEVLSPYTPDTIICIGLNYKEHAAESGFKLPKYPVVFHKSKNSITGPFSNIELHPAAGQVDYENELCFVISKDAKDVPEDKAHEYILAYTVGNDVSSRQWQAPDASGGQFCYAKNFDGFCPFGPKLVSPTAVADPQDLKIETRRNGKVVQSSNTSDMIFGGYTLISFLSQGTTIPAGTLVMTGTPPGVAMFASTPPDFLKKGEVVECYIENIGTLKNEFV